MAVRATPLGIDPRWAQTLDVFHVNQVNYSLAPINMNTATLRGDMFFALRSKSLPLECGPWLNKSFWSRFDCEDPEVKSTVPLAITRLKLEVDSRYSQYEDCNVNAVTGAYECECDSAPPPSAPQKCSAHFNYWSDDCLNGTRLRALRNTTQGACCAACSAAGSACAAWAMPGGFQGGECDLLKHPLVRLENAQHHSPCKAAIKSGVPNSPCDSKLVGRMNLSLWDKIYPRDHTLNDSITNWHENTVHKTGGLWFSTEQEGQCASAGAGPGPGPANCSWRVIKPVKKIFKACSDRVINKGVEQRGAACFEECAQPHNASSQCWIECFYKTVLGEESANTPNAAGGMSVDELEQLWLTPFTESDPSKGGCPDLL